MNITCERMDDLLFEGDAASLAVAAQHAAACEDCRVQLEAWTELSLLAPALHEEWQSDMLLPRVKRALAEDKPRRRAWLNVAAAITFTVALASSVFYVVNMRSHEEAFDRSILRMSAVDEVERAEKSHVAAIRQLEKVAAPKLDAAEDPLMLSYKEKLLLLDDAIAECRTNIERNQQNAHLRKQLLAMYTDKQQTLREVVQEANRVDHQ